MYERVINNNLVLLKINKKLARVTLTTLTF